MSLIDREDEFLSLISKKLKPERFIHSKNVAKSAMDLARIFDVDEEKAYITGLLHDVTKNCDEKEHLKIFSECDIILSNEEMQNKNVWHQISGAAFLEHELKITDSEILDGVRWHTTGKRGMSTFSKVIYMADLISAERDYPDVFVTRALAKENLDLACYYSLTKILPMLIFKGNIIDKNSVDFYNELTENKQLLKISGETNDRT